MFDFLLQSPFNREVVEESTNSILESESTFPERGLASTKSRLVIDCVDGDAEAIYTCVAQSRTEKIVASTYVHIEGVYGYFFELKWTLKLIDFFSIGEAHYNETACIMRHEMELLPASIFMWSGTYIDKEGEDAVLICRAAGNPLPKISWYYGDDELILPGPNFQVKIFNYLISTRIGLINCFFVGKPDLAEWRFENPSSPLEGSYGSLQMPGKKRIWNRRIGHISLPSHGNKLKLNEPIVIQSFIHLLLFHRTRVK